ncbi:Glutamyl-tRNA reductase [Lachnospiraceae bacterium TWA4]|nr:Glutamyl-tRNA reductase [Lachnospiraceae bacterium TWA4]
MIGIDHSKATVSYRELFSFTKTGIAAAMENFLKVPGVEGCLLLSTCNRMELWISATDKLEVSLYDMLCQEKGIDSDEYRELFTERCGEEAVIHLFETASGLKSKIIGEDQIITQVKEALSLAREVFSTDKVLEMLFRTAVTARKKVKTNVRLTNADSSAISGPIHALKKQGIDFSKLTCMVIGNGEMGKLAATALRQEGADVTVTVRQYRSGQVLIPEGCSRINYGERLDYLKSCDLVVSATSSPNYTLKLSEVESVPRKDHVIMIDLAVPRDIEDSVGQLEGIELYDIDSFGTEIEHEQLEANIEKSHEILQEFIHEFKVWYECRDLIPVVKEVSAKAAKDVTLRLTKPMRKLDAKDEQKEDLEQAIDTATSKVIGKILFCLRDSLDAETFRDCVDAVSQIYE